MTLTPAYGRDYRSKRAAVADLMANKDFIINSFASPYDGKPINLSQLREIGEREVKIRYSQLRRETMVQI